VTQLLEAPLVEPEVREGTYGAATFTVEPGGAGMVPDGERHGRPIDLLWTWMSPNFEFATVFVGVLAVAAFGQSFWQAFWAIALGSGLGALCLGVLSARGPEFGIPQMMLSRIPFGRLGNILPAGLNAATAGIGWFAVNSVSGALALNSLIHVPKVVGLIIVVAVQLTVAFFGHNLIQKFERYVAPALAVIFLVTTVIILSKSHPSALHQHGGSGAFLVVFGATFGYAAGWTPYGTDYTRYLPRTSSGFMAGVWAAVGVFVSCTVLEVAGAASVTIHGANIGDALGDPTSSFVHHTPTVIADLTLLAIAFGAVAANAINIYSGSMSFLAIGVKLPLGLRRAIVALVFGAIGFVLALFGLHNAGSTYENFLLIIAYWIGPWLGVYFTDQLLRKKFRLSDLVFSPGTTRWPGSSR